ncbi:hypothetical protein [Virgisporangium aliadipatigenens]|nr:hypothetical protein [Virgisporangium aliadipatigenens]
MVFRSRRGRLLHPAGGYTSGELWWRGPRVAYEVDITSHPLHCRWSLGAAEPGGPCTVVVHGTWSVGSPVDVVANRITDSPGTVLERLREEAHRVARESGHDGALGWDTATLRMFPRKILVKGIEVEVSDVAVRPRRPDEGTDLSVREIVDLLLDADDDAATRWRHDSDLVRAVRSVLEHPDGVPAEERDAVLAEAVRRLDRLVARIGELLPRG